MKEKIKEILDEKEKKYLFFLREKTEEAMQDLLKEVEKEIEEMILNCKRHCFCRALPKTGLTSQDKCANCHSVDQLEELKNKLSQIDIKEKVE